MSKFEDLAPNGSDWVARELRALREEIAELRAARSSEATTVASGGLEIKDGGSLRIRHPETGKTIYHAGEATNQNFDGSYVVAQYRNDGTATLVPRQVVEEGHPLEGVQVLAWHDREGGVLIRDDYEGVGLAMPWGNAFLTPRFNPLGAPGTTFSYRTLPAANVTTETVMWEGYSLIIHPRLQVAGTWGDATGATNSTTYRLKIGTDVIGTWTRSGGAFGTTFEGPFDVSAYVRQNLLIQLTLVATGTGNVACELYAAQFRGSEL